MARATEGPPDGSWKRGSRKKHNEPAPEGDAPLDAEQQKAKVKKYIAHAIVARAAKSRVDLGKLSMDPGEFDSITRKALVVPALKRSPVTERPATTSAKRKRQRDD